MRLFCLALLLVTKAFAAPMLKAEIIASEIGVEDYQARPTLCVTTVREINSGKLYGIVEDITDCYWTRQARRNPSIILEIPFASFHSTETDEMRTHLQGFDSQLEFLWSNAD